MLTVVATALVALLYASVLEWLVHRFGYHDEHVWTRATRAHRRHHDVLYTARSFFERSGRYETSQPWWLEAAYVAAHSPLFALLFVLSPAMGITSALVVSGYAALAHYVHPATHLRTGAWWERTRLFKRLVARHVRHHQDTSIHFNVLLPFGDWLFGTTASGRMSYPRRGRALRSDLDPA